MTCIWCREISKKERPYFRRRQATCSPPSDSSSPASPKGLRTTEEGESARRMDALHCRAHKGSQPLYSVCLIDETRELVVIRENKVRSLEQSASLELSPGAQIWPSANIPRNPRLPLPVKAPNAAEFWRGPLPARSLAAGSGQ